MKSARNRDRFQNASYKWRPEYPLGVLAIAAHRNDVEQTFSRTHIGSQNS